MSVIEFPALGLKIPLNPIALHLGNISIYWYGIIIAASFMLAVFLAMRESKKFGLEEENIIDLVLFAAPISIVFARMYYVIFSWDKYSSNPSEIVKIWHGGLAIYGALIGALTVAFVFARYKKISAWKLFDFCIPYVALAQAIGRWGNFVNQEAYGVNTTLPWGMTSEKIKSELSVLQMQGVKVDPNLPVHPTFLYESLWNLGVFLLLLLWFRKRKKLEGEVFFLYMVLYGIGRFWIEGLRTDSLMLGSFRISQVLALLFAMSFGIAFFIRRKKAAKVADAAVESGPSEYGAILKQIKEAEKEEAEGSREANEVNMQDTEGEKEENLKNGNSIDYKGNSNSKTDM